MDSTNEYYRMLNALSKIYISIYTFDLKRILSILLNQMNI